MIEPIYQPAASRYEDGMTYRRAGRSGVLLPAFSLGMCCLLYTSDAADE